MAEAMRFGDRVLFLWEGEGGEGEGEKKKEEKGEKKKKRRHKTQITTKRLSIPIQLNSLLNTRKIKHRLPPYPLNTTTQHHQPSPLPAQQQSTPLISALPCPSLPLPPPINSITCNLPTIPHPIPKLETTRFERFQ